MALEYSIWENLCVCFPHPLPGALDSASLESCLKSPISFCQWGGWALLPPVWPPMSNLGLHGYLPFERAVGASGYSLFY